MVIALSIVGGAIGASCIAAGAVMVWKKYRKLGVLPEEYI
jgi:phosphate/sulfate permease